MLPVVQWKSGRSLTKMPEKVIASPPIVAQRGDFSPSPAPRMIGPKSAPNRSTNRITGVERHPPSDRVFQRLVDA